MRKDDLERRAAAMRARHTTAAATAATTETSSRGAAVLTIPELPSASPYSLLRGAWKSSHTKLLLSALGDAQPLVLRTARSIGTQQVAFDGLIYLHGNGVLDVAASPRMFPEALRLYDLLLQAVAKRGGEGTVTNATTITLRGETLEIRLREGSDRRPKQTGSAGFRENEYFPTGQLWFSVIHEHGSNMKTLARDLSDVDAFLDKLSRFVDRMPKLRDQRKERERVREEEWERKRARWKREEDQRRQWREQQERFNEVISDIEQRTKAEGVRAYTAAFEAHHVATHGAVEVGGFVDGWLRWMHWYAEHLDPITRPEGPKQRPPGNDLETEES